MNSLSERLLDTLNVFTQWQGWLAMAMYGIWPAIAVYFLSRKGKIDSIKHWAVGVGVLIFAVPFIVSPQSYGSIFIHYPPQILNVFFWCLLVFILLTSFISYIFGEKVES